MDNAKLTSELEKHTIVVLEALRKLKSIAIDHDIPEDAQEKIIKALKDETDDVKKTLAKKKIVFKL